ncbi:hypothetical protein F5884DRAFT_793077 [Xylogone sp. PMI_703]|nr:hypothetical protein F5884DRAFT_793077 [Xylogone sp. PMI_703]
MSETQDSDSSSSSSSPSPEPAEIPRYRQHLELRKLLEEVRPLPPYLSRRNFNRLNIHATQITLNENGEPCPEFRFFKPHQGTLPRVDEQRMGSDKFFEYGDDAHWELKFSTFERSRELHYYFLRYLSLCAIDINEEEQEDWSFKDIVDFKIPHSLAGPKYSVEYLTDDEAQRDPHLECHIIHGFDGDSRLFRDEVCTIIRLITSRFESQDFTQHRIVPVLMFSFFGRQHARILHAHYDRNEKELLIAYSQTFDFRVVNNNALQLLARWSYSHRIGNTKREGFQTAGLPIRPSLVEIHRGRQREEERLVHMRQFSAERYTIASNTTTDSVRSAFEFRAANMRRASAERHLAASLAAAAEVTRAMQMLENPQEQENIDI